MPRFFILTKQTSILIKKVAVGSESKYGSEKSSTKISTQLR